MRRFGIWGPAATKGASGADAITSLAKTLPRHCPFPRQFSSSTDDVIRVTFHTDSLLRLEDERARLRDLLAGFCPEHLDIVMTPRLSDVPLPKALSSFPVIAFRPVESEFKNTYAAEISGQSAGFMAFYTRQHVASMFERKEEEPAVEALHSAVMAMLASRALDSDLFVSEDKEILAHRNELSTKCEVWILGLLEALDYFDACCKGRGVYLFNPIAVGDKRLYYEERAQELLPELYVAWTAVHRAGSQVAGSREIMEYLRSLHERLILALDARDRIAYQYYLPATMATNDEMAYHLSFFLLLVTAMFDSLAWICKHLYELDLRDRQVDLRYDEFRKPLRDKSPSLEARIARKLYLVRLFYPMRNSIAHRHPLRQAGYEDFSKKSGYSLIEIQTKQQKAIGTLDTGDASDGFTKWGLIKVADATFIEPYRFVDTALQELLPFWNGFLGALGLGSLAGSNRTREESSEARRREWPPGFAIPFFRR